MNPLIRLCSLSILMAGTILGSHSAAASIQPGKENQKNLVVVLVDDLGWTDLGCYGSSFYDTPSLDELASAGIRFENAYAASPVCSPTRAALMTGRHPVRVNITDWIRGHNQKDALLVTPEDRDELALEEVTLAEVLKEHGYTTGYFGKWHLGETEEYWPEHQGFDVNAGGHSKGSPPKGYYSPYGNPRLPDGPEGEYLTDRLTDEAISFMQDHQEDPFLVYLAYYSVHTPIQGAKKWDAEYAAKREALDLQDPDATAPEEGAKTRLHQSNAKYAAMVRSVDENVGRLLAELDALGLAEDTVVVFTSDNGGLSTQGGLAPTSNRPLRSGKGWCYEGGIRVPLIIRAPGKTEPASVSQQTATSMDLMPTVLDLLDLPGRPQLHLDGVSLAPAIADQGTTVPRTLVWHYPHYHGSTWTPGTAIRSGDWKLIKRYETGDSQLFNLAEDPSESKDLSTCHPEKLAEMEAGLEDWLNRMGAQRPFPVSDNDTTPPRNIP